MVSSLGFPLGSAIGGALIGGLGVPGVILAIACSYLLLGLLPLLAPALRGLDAAAGSRLQIRPTTDLTLVGLEPPEWCGGRGVASACDARTGT
jgi:hypothetical protein